MSGRFATARPRRGTAPDSPAGAASASRSTQATSPPTPPAPEAIIDEVELAVAARQERRSLGRLAQLLGRSVRLVYQAGGRLFIANAALQLAGGLVIAIQVVITKDVLQAILHAQQNGQSVAGAIPAVAALALVTAFTTVSGAVQQQQQRVLSELVTRSTWSRILDVTGSVTLRSFESSTFYDRLQRVQTNAVARPYFLTQGLIGMVGAATGSAGLTIAILTLQPLLLPLILLSAIPMLYSSRIGGRLEFAFAVSQATPLRLRQYLTEVQTGRDQAKEIRAFGLRQALRRRYDDVYERSIRDLRAHARRRSTVALLGSTASAVLLAATLALLLWLVSKHQVTLAEAGAGIVAIRLLAQQMQQLFLSTQQIFESGMFLEDLEGFLALQPAAETSESGEEAPDAFGVIEVNNVCFAYPGSSTSALDDVSLTVKAGEVVALVGENGSGKSTLAKLLAGLYEPDHGVIAWDGVDIRSYDKTSLRTRIAIIFQDFVRYQLTARENIGLGRPDAEDDTTGIRHAAMQAGAHAFLEALPNKYETILSKAFKGGRDLSLGQWQRVALARAFYRDAPLVVLDEPSASLDPRAEHELFSHLRELLGGRTVLFISHRFSTVRSADRIFVLREGRVIENGSHAELMRAGQHYAELFRLQAAAYLDSTAEN